MKMTNFLAAFAAAFLLLGSGNAFAAASSYEVVADQQQVRITGTVVMMQKTVGDGCREEGRF